MRIGVLGAARITPKALIAPAMVIPSCELVGIAARNRTHAEDFAEKYDIEAVYEDYNALTLADDIDLIYNPLPNNLHAIWAIKALEQGKHVLCEKPFAMNLSEAVAIQIAAEKSGKRVIEAFHYRYHPGFETLLSWLGSTVIGDIQSIRAHFNTPIKNTGEEIRYMPETGGGAMMDLGCYPLNWVLHLIKTDLHSVEASATLTPTGVDEAMNATLEFNGGVRAFIETSMSLKRHFSAGLHIFGEKGEIMFNNPLAPHLGSSLTLQTGEETTKADVSRISTYTYQLAAVLDGLANGITLPTEGEIILRQQKVIDTVYVKAGLGHLRSI